MIPSEKLYEMPPLTFKEAIDVENAILRCPFEGCNARLIRLQPALKSSQIVVPGAPKMTQESTDFFQIADVWDFDNIGVSKPAELESALSVPLAKVERLLICGECDQGPLGFAGFVSAEESDVKKLSYFLSCESVLYDVTV